jgi:hypothetical protein
VLLLLSVAASDFDVEHCRLLVLRCHVLQDYEGVVLVAAFVPGFQMRQPFVLLFEDKVRVAVEVESAMEGGHEALQLLVERGCFGPEDFLIKVQLGLVEAFEQLGAVMGQKFGFLAADLM